MVIPDPLFIPMHESDGYHEVENVGVQVFVYSDVSGDEGFLQVGVFDSEVIRVG